MGKLKKLGIVAGLAAVGGVVLLVKYVMDHAVECDGCCCMCFEDDCPFREEDHICKMGEGDGNA